MQKYEKEHKSKHFSPLKIQYSVIKHKNVKQKYYYKTEKH